MWKVRDLARSAMALTLVPVVAGAQLERQFVFTPYVGLYAPTNNVATLGTSAGGTAITASMKHKSSVALGATASYWFTGHAGFEVGGAYAYSDAKGWLDIGGTGVSTIGDNARMVFGTAKFMVSLMQLTNDTQLRFGIGPAVINRGGAAYKSDLDGKPKGLTNVGAAASLCTRIPLTNLVAIRVRAEDYMYQARLKWESSTDPLENMAFGKKFQHDLLFSAGLQIGFRR